MSNTNLPEAGPLDNAALVCESVICSASVLSQILAVQRDCPADPQTPLVVSKLLEVYAGALNYADGAAEA